MGLLRVAASSNYRVQRIILVADRGILSVDNLAMLDALKVADGALEYIVAVPGRRYAEFVQVLAEVQPLRVAATAEVVGEVPWSLRASRAVHFIEAAEAVNEKSLSPNL